MSYTHTQVEYDTYDPEAHSDSAAYRSMEIPFLKKRSKVVEVRSAMGLLNGLIYCVVLSNNFFSAHYFD